MGSPAEALSIPWPIPSDPRKEEKIKLLASLHFEVSASDESSLSLLLPSEPSAAFQEALEALQLLVLSDLELALLPLEAATRRALRRLDACARRRALLAARKLLKADFAVKAQAELDKLCAGSQPLGLHRTTRPDGAWLHAAAAECALPGRGRGLIATEAVKAGEEVLRVPEAALLNVFSALNSEGFGEAARGLLAEGLHADAVAMVFAVVEEKRCRAGGEAPWGELLRRTPSLAETQQLLAWPIEAIEALARPEVTEVVKGSLAKLWELTEEVAQAVKKLPDGLVEPLGFDELLWAKCVFDSRAVAAEVAAPEALRDDVMEGGDGEQWLQLGGARNLRLACPTKITCLPPCVELLNHETYGALMAPVFENRSLVVAAAAAVKAGAEMCLCYGPLQNWELLLYYGFCPEVNPHDRLTISIAPPDEEEEDAEAYRSLILQAACIPTDHVLRPLLPGEPATSVDAEGWECLGILPPQLLRCLRICLAPDPGAVDFSAVPGTATAAALDVQCLELLEGLLKELLVPLEPLEPKPTPLWWSLYGDAVRAFRSSQRQLLEANLEAARSLRLHLQAVAEGGAPA